MIACTSAVATQNSSALIFLAMLAYQATSPVYSAALNFGKNIRQSDDALSKNFFKQEESFVKNMFSSLLLSLLSVGALADTVTLGNPAYGGNGCPAGSASATLSPDRSALTMLFDQFMINVGGSAGKNTDRKSCNIAIPVHIPSGLSVSIFKIDYRGFNNLPASAFSQFGVEYFFAGTAGPRVNKRFNGPLSDNYLIGNNLVGQAVTWSSCGQEVILRANTNIMLVSPRGQEAMSTLDSMDIKSGIVYHLQWRKC